MEKIESNLIETVTFLSSEIGERSFRHAERLDLAAGYIEDKFSSYGYAVKKQAFQYEGGAYYNVIAESGGGDRAHDGILVVGAHYDTVVGTPGADDNASGVACLLELARLASSHPGKRPVRFAAFSLEEPPVFFTRDMGSYHYARSLRDEGVKVKGMISLEMLGYYCDYKGSQVYPASLFKLFYPDKGDFIAFVGNLSSRSFTNGFRRSFTAASSFPVESLNGLSIIPGVDFSDHRCFWKFGFPAFMITDTAFYRNPNYHGPGDTADTLDYKKMAELVEGIHGALQRI